MDRFRSGTLVAMLLILPAPTGCQALFGKARVEIAEEAAISKSVKDRLAAEKTVTLTSVEVETNSGTVYLSGTVTSLAARERAPKLAWETRVFRPSITCKWENNYATHLAVGFRFFGNVTRNLVPFPAQFRGNTAGNSFTIVLYLSRQFRAAKTLAFFLKFGVKYRNKKQIG